MNMDERVLKKQARRYFGRQAVTLLVFYLLMNAAVFGVILVDVMIRAVQAGIAGTDIDAAMDLALEAAMSNAWGYALAYAIGLGILFCWKKKDFWRQEIWKPGKPIKPVTVFYLLCVCTAGQLVFQGLAILLELLFNALGLTLLASVESASATADSFSMFLYMGLIAPVGEELLFRGLLMRSLEPCGKRFAVLTSAFLFGIYHGNLLQSPYAFLVGLVLGYTAMEYSIGWAMVLHMFNNLILGDLLTRLLTDVPEAAANLIFYGIVLALTVVAIAVMLLKKREIAAWRQDRIHPWYLKCFFTSPAVIILTVLMILNACLLITPL